MLIRSQNKDILMPLEKCIIDIVDNTVAFTNDINSKQVVLGVYSTQGKAIKVLDMIQNSYQYCEECKCIGVGASQPEFVFQMPNNYEV